MRERRVDDFAHRRGRADSGASWSPISRARGASATSCSAAPSTPATFTPQLALPIFVATTTCGACWRWCRRGRGPSTPICSRCCRASRTRSGLAVSPRRAAGRRPARKSRRLEALARLAQGLTGHAVRRPGARARRRRRRRAAGGSMARLWLLDDDGQRAHPGRVRRAGGCARWGCARWRSARAVSGSSSRLAGLHHDARRPRATRARATPAPVRGGASPRPPACRWRSARVLRRAGRRDHRAARLTTEEELSLLQSLANQAAIAIDNARLFFEEQTRRARITTRCWRSTPDRHAGADHAAAVVDRRGGGPPARARQRRLPLAGGRRAGPGRPGGAPPCRRWCACACGWASPERPRGRGRASLAAGPRRELGPRGRARRGAIAPAQPHKFLGVPLKIE